MPNAQNPEMWQYKSPVKGKILCQISKIWDNTCQDIFLKNRWQNLENEKSMCIQGLCKASWLKAVCISWIEIWFEKKNELDFLLLKKNFYHFFVKYGVSWEWQGRLSQLTCSEIRFSGFKGCAQSIDNGPLWNHDQSTCF